LEEAKGEIEVLKKKIANFSKSSGAVSLPFLTCLNNFYEKQRFKRKTN
jgi:hypothetical protein